MDNKIKLLVVSPNKTGVGYYRSLNPHIFMDEKYSNEIHIDIVDFFDFSNENSGLGYDLIHFHANTPGKTDVMLNKIMFLQRKGIKLIMDLDDYWILPQHFPQYREYNVKLKYHERIISLIKIVDYVTTTTEIFANEIRKHNKNVAVIPNAINQSEDQFKNRNKKTDRLRVGIICGASHEEDIKLLNGMVSQLKDDIDKIQFVICGFDTRGDIKYKDVKTGEIKTRNVRPDETVWHVYEKILTDNYKIIDKNYFSYLMSYNQNVEYPDIENMPYKRCWTKPVNKYATHYNDIDVLLVPLVENQFNKCKSQLKVIEAGFFNKVIIAQNYGPYTLDLKPYLLKDGELNENGNALLVDSRKNHKQWSKYIKFLLNNPDHRTKLANNLTNDIVKNYNIETVCEKRFELYKKIKNL